jgi:heme-degrading monooxygenase HmoA
MHAVAMAFAAVFTYEIEPAGAEAFEAVDGPEGEWARFFRSGAGYLGTELWSSVGQHPRRYLVIDRWRSAASYSAFLREHEEDYRRRSRAAEVLYRTETMIGRFEAGDGPA